MEIAGRTIGGEAPVFIIAEASANHEGNATQAAALVHAAADAGADAIKFQTFRAERIAAAGVAPAWGHDAAHDAWLEGLGVRELRDLFRYGGLPRPWHRPLADLAASRGLIFLSTPFSVDDARFLVDEVGVSALKIASGDLTYAPLLAYAATTGLPVLLSTGGAFLEEVDEAVARVWPAYQGGRLALLHCVSAYPARPSDCNLRAIPTLQQRFPLARVGWSDHTLEPTWVPALAVALGATVLEKHLTLERTAGRVDAGHSLTPPEFARMVAAVRAAPRALGDGVKRPQPAEGHDRLWARRGADGLRPTEAARQGRWA